MTKAEFLRLTPATIQHKTSGYGELKISKDTKEEKIVGYKHKDTTTSGGTTGASWADVFDKLSKYLIKEGFMEK
ncbi:MAG: hypothetical protein SGJ10_06650 [Bacteroidota bacterium]|nr:hypothetical protein [Bacteroidota bacterium]